MKTNSIIKTLLIICVITFISCNNSTEKKSDSASKVEKTSIIGDWLRTDAQYLIRITKLNDNGTMTAQYFNPNPINVGKANWESSYGNLKAIVEMRDVNYPGSKYTLSYLPDRDILAGEYYQAVEGVTFYVEFMRKE